MKIFSPQARFKINSSIHDYIKALFWFLSNQKNIDDYVFQLEQQIKNTINVPFAIAMPQARVGIFLAISSCVEPGQEVILSPNTIADVINMVICAGAKPVFCDIDSTTGNLDPNLVERLITSKTAAIMVTHLYGLIAPMSQFKELATKHRLLLVEDAAQAFGAKLNGMFAGTIGDVGIFSFGMAKNVPAFFGGMLVTQREDIAAKVRQRMTGFSLMDSKKLKNKVISCFIKEIATIDFIFSSILFKLFRYGYKKNIHSITKFIESELDLSRKHELPNNYKETMTSLQAEIILSKLHKVESDFHHRLKCAKIYYEGLKDIPDLLIPPMIEDGSHVYNYYPIGYKDRQKLRMFLFQKNRDVALQHIKNTADLPAFNDFFNECPNSRCWAQQTIMMPNYAKYRLDEVKSNVQAIRQFFECGR